MPRMRTRGHAGTAIIWKESLDYLIDPLPDSIDRVLVIKVNAKSPSPSSTYMPMEGAVQPVYEETLDEIHEIINYHDTNIIHHMDWRHQCNKALAKGNNK